MAAATLVRCCAGLYAGFDDADAGGDEAMDPRGGSEPYNCPFCGEDFDFVGLCCHIDDEHAVEANTGVKSKAGKQTNNNNNIAFYPKQVEVCPICAMRVGMDLIGHLTMQHGSYFKMQRRRRVRKISSGSHSLLSLLRKDLRDGSLQSFLGGSSHVSNPPAAAPDPFLSSLVCNFPVAEPSKDLHSDSSDNNFLLNKIPDEKTVERAEPSLSEKDQKERAQRSEFVRGLVLSTIFDDDNL